MVVLLVERHFVDDDLGAVFGAVRVVVVFGAVRLVVLVALVVLLRERAHLLVVQLGEHRQQGVGVLVVVYW